MEGGYSAQVQISEYFLEDARYVEQFSAQEYPHLIYDGPFSQSLETAPALAGATKVSKEQAQKTAEEFAGTALQFVGYSAADKVPFFTFCGQDGQNVAVSELGGEILFWNISHETDISVAPTEQKAEELKAVALDFLEQKGYPQCELSYAQYYGGDALLNLVPLQDDLVGAVPAVMDQDLFASLRLDQFTDLFLRFAAKDHFRRGIVDKIFHRCVLSFSKFIMAEVPQIFFSIAMLTKKRKSEVLIRGTFLEGLTLAIRN